jgi:serine/threonine-protein kinase RsbW
MSSVFSLRIAADVHKLAAIRQFVEEKARALDAEPSAISDLVLAVNEMATNIVVHGYRGRPGTIDLELRQIGDAIEARLRDQAPLFDPTRVPEPDLTLPLDKRSLGGMGIHCTRQLVDTMRYHVTLEGGNELILVKRGTVARSPKE